MSIFLRRTIRMFLAMAAGICMTASPIAAAEKGSPGTITDDELIGCFRNHTACSDACAKGHNEPSVAWCQNSSNCKACIDGICGSAYLACKAGALAARTTGGKSTATGGGKTGVKKQGAVGEAAGKKTRAP